MTKNYVCHTPYLRNCTSYDRSFWHTCKMMISLELFSFFSELWFFGFLGGGGRKMTNITNFSLLHSISQELQIISRFLVHRCKMMISPAVFLYFLKKYNIVNIEIVTFLWAHFNSFFSKQLFFKFINKCRSEILSCAPSSSHVCDFFSY